MNQDNEPSALGFALFMYVVITVLAAIAVSVLGDDGIKLPKELNAEGKFVTRIGIAILWPTLVVAGVIFALVFIARGFAQVVRFATPRQTGPAPLPKAQVRK